MQRSTLDFWVGLFVMAGIGALLVLAMKVGNMSSVGSGETYALTANFDNIGGLKPRAPVKSAGVVVGRVEDITFDDKAYQASVYLAMQSRYVFPKDSSLKILTSGLLGEQYIGVEAGGDEKNLATGDVVKQTQSAVVLENLISQFLFSKAADSSSGSSPAPPSPTPGKK